MYVYPLTEQLIGFLSMHLLSGSLGVLPHSETSTDGMVNILDLLNEYNSEVTVDENSKILPLAMGGDMLSAARVRTAQDASKTWQLLSVTSHNN